MYDSALNSLIPQENHTLKLADGSSWTIIEKSEEGSKIGCLLAQTLQLHPSTLATSQKLILGKTSTSSNAAPLIFSEETLKAVAGNTNITCRLNPLRDPVKMVSQLLELSQIFCCKAEIKGGLAIHGALAEKNGNGFILAGYGNVGKTTASRRLPSPWRSHSDDSSLIVLDKQKIFRAHPWPTWSSLISGEKLQTWDIQYSIPLKAIFVLRQSSIDKVEPIGRGRAVCLLNEVADQAWWGLDTKLKDENKQALRLKRFDNICKMVETIPVYLLHISKTGHFWKEIDKVLP